MEYKKMENENYLIPLFMLREGEEGIVEKIYGGRGLVKRLLDLGFTPGTRIKVLHSNSYGPLVIEVRGSKLAIGRGIARKVYVSLYEL